MSDALQFGRSEPFAPSPILAEDVAALRLRPGFAAAVSASAAAMVELYKSNRLLNAIVNDRGRLVISSLAVHLHYSAVADDPRSGLTPARVKAFCAAEGICSPGRAAAVLALMRWGGYLAPAPQAANTRSNRLLATQALLDMHFERWRRQLSVVSTLMAEGKAGLENLERPGFAAAFAAAQAAQFVSGFRFANHAPSLALFFERNCGLLILSNFVVSAWQAGRQGGGGAPVSISALARRFGVSRPHVIALLRDAEAAGLLRRVGPQGAELVLSPRLMEDVERFFAAVFLFNAHCVRSALAAPPRA